jgi:hypothetical protein
VQVRKAYSSLEELVLPTERDQIIANQRHARSNGNAAAALWRASPSPITASYHTVLTLGEGREGEKTQL